MKKSFLLLLVFIILISCEENKNSVSNEHDHKQKQIDEVSSNEHSGHHHGHNHANKHMHNTPVSELIEAFEGDERATTQKPYEVIALLGDIDGKKILDIGAGSGYFSFKMAEKGADVIAGDVNDEFLTFIKDKCSKVRMAKGSVVPKKLPFDSPELSPEEIDIAIIVNTYHHIEDRVTYFSKVLKGLKPNGRLMVVDFMKKRFDEEVDGPPYEMRISSKVVMRELKEAGFSSFELFDELLPYQFALIAGTTVDVEAEITGSNPLKKNENIGEIVKKEEFKELKYMKFNSELVGLDRSLSPKEIMKRYYPIDVSSSEGNQEISITSRKVDAETTIITLIHDNLLDDSMKGKKYVMKLELNYYEWMITSLKTNWRCREGRGHKDWGIENCK